MTRPRTRPTRTAALPSQRALGRASCSRPRCEPVETENPVNEQLDLIEAHCRDVLAAGGEFALVTRLRKLLPGHIVADGGAGRQQS